MNIVVNGRRPSFVDAEGSNDVVDIFSTVVDLVVGSAADRVAEAPALSVESD